jgi:predicted transcriptional regulator
MSDKEAVLELINRLPSEVSLREILKEIEFVAAIKEGLDELDQGQGVSIEAVENMIEAWITP